MPSQPVRTPRQLGVGEGLAPGTDGDALRGEGRLSLEQLAEGMKVRQRAPRIVELEKQTATLLLAQERQVSQQSVRSERNRREERSELCEKDADLLRTIEIRVVAYLQQEALTLPRDLQLQLEAVQSGPSPLHLEAEAGRFEGSEPGGVLKCQGKKRSLLQSEVLLPSLRLDQGLGQLPHQAGERRVGAQPRADRHKTGEGANRPRDFLIFTAVEGRAHHDLLLASEPADLYRPGGEHQGRHRDGELVGQPRQGGRLPGVQAQTGPCGSKLRTHRARTPEWQISRPLSVVVAGMPPGPPGSRLRGFQQIVLPFREVDVLCRLGEMGRRIAQAGDFAQQSAQRGGVRA
jgi:hypothetical protein